jgi:NADPH-dependent ferric siderophore reductase
VTLAAQQISAVNGGVRVWLNWTFDQPLSASDRRFVHVLDADGRLVAQDDAALPALAAWAESLDFALPPGTYRLYTGWYSLPDAARFAVLADEADAAAGLIALGAVTVASAE